MLTKEECRARYNYWGAKLDAYIAKFLPIVNELEKRKMAALKAACDAYNSPNFGEMHAEGELAWFAHENARREYSANWDKMRVMRDAAKYELEDETQALAAVNEYFARNEAQAS